MPENYPFAGHVGNTHGFPPFTELGGGGRDCPYCVLFLSPQISQQV